MSAQTVASVPSTPPDSSNSSSSWGAEDSHSRPKRRGRPGRSPRSVRRTLLSALAIVLALLWVFPVYWMVNSAFLDKVTLQETTPTFLPIHIRQRDEAMRELDVARADGRTRAAEAHEKTVERLNTIIDALDDHTAVAGPSEATRAS